MFLYKYTRERFGEIRVLIPEWCNDEPYCYLYAMWREIRKSINKRETHNLNQNIFLLKKWINQSSSTVDNAYLNQLNQIFENIKYENKINRETEGLYLLNPKKQYAMKIYNSLCRKILYLLPSLSEQEYNQLVEDNHE